MYLTRGHFLDSLRTGLYLYLCLLLLILQPSACIMPGKTILVTGGGGYIGSHCILQLLKEDFNVIAVDNFVNSIKGKIFFAILLHNTNYILLLQCFTDVKDSGKSGKLFS